MPNPARRRPSREIRTLLLVLSDPRERATFRSAALAEGLLIEEARSPAEACLRLPRGGVDVVAADADLPEGIELLAGASPERLAVVSPERTADALARLRTEAIYLPRPLREADARAALERASRPATLRQTSAALEEARSRRTDEDEIVGASGAWREAVARVEEAAATGVTVLLTGESGTGKEVLARLLHRRSARRGRPFVTLHCAALSSNVLESELFGHERGAFTGAVRTREGRFEYASGGTLFLDEVADIPAAVQAKLLRVLEERLVTRVGSNTPIPVDVRVVAATHRPIEDLLRSGRFREDLAFRLRGVSIPLPPLRARRGDIPLLADHFLTRFARAAGRPSLRLAPEALDALLRYDWPGNVREMRHAIESLVVRARGNLIRASDLPEALFASPGGALPKEIVTVDDAERTLIARTLEACGGRRKEAARRLGVGERTLYRKIRTYGLPARRRRRAHPGR
ncbi:MAG: sigma-54-dependent Fis family transcriptional regulator [Planctomycetes bacterium]|nr:sigma-54-dependent Fis family transcriptional regulator [Planctomycetota bacterium]